MLSTPRNKPNAVRYFDSETFAITIAQREIAATWQLLDTAQREIEAADLSPEAQDLVGAQFSRLYQKGMSTIRNANEDLEIFKACAILRGEPDMVAA